MASWRRPDRGLRTAPADSPGADATGRGLVVVVNAGAGGGPASALVGPSPVDRIRELLPAAEILRPETMDGLDDLLEEAAGRCRVLGVFGGDGTVRAGAAAALRHSRPLLPLPGGTLNNFAATLGLVTVDDAVRAYRRQRVGGVDIGEVDGRIFLNTASFGVQARLFDLREQLRPRLGRWLSMAVAAWRAMHEAEPVDIAVDGRTYHAWWVFVGNGRHRTHALLPTRRERLDDGVLDVRVLRARRPFRRLRGGLALVLGDWGPTSGYKHWRTPRITITADTAELRVACDGETAPAPAVLLFHKHRRRLAVFHTRDAPAPRPTARRRA
ncbi:diacylglycerol kinase family protein [Nocardiopsis sp. RSe5-2]|uniref:Diacylglycerol kinase family protein n=1 Tax=Nocardiopsis endophytica TaxID=3018445 RepID=A0ABT4U1Y7_9ACTN|nr:diacylglycerol kinase family protein [Nocardiopsis endophytica]MDA2810937.1 diacylglycerol kinase family protein [Nocardiopsis endophytica]